MRYANSVPSIDQKLVRQFKKETGGVKKFTRFSSYHLHSLTSYNAGIVSLQAATVGFV